MGCEHTQALDPRSRARAPVAASARRLRNRFVAARSAGPFRPRSARGGRGGRGGVFLFVFVCRSVGSDQCGSKYHETHEILK